MQEQENELVSEEATEVTEVNETLEATEVNETPEAPQEVKEAEEVEPATEEAPLLFSLHFKIPLPEYAEFHRIMSADTVAKNKKKTTIMGYAEMALALVFLVLTVIGAVGGGLFQLLLMVALLGFGFYSAFYYRLFYEKALAKAISKQYNKSPFLTTELCLDFYRDHCIERSDGGEACTRFEDLYGIKTTPTLILIMVEEKRSLLIPRSQIKEQEAALEALLDEISATYHKKRIDL